MSQWYYVKNGQKEGPVETHQLQQLLQSASISGDSLVWKDGMADWIAANKLPDFSSTAIVEPPAGEKSAGIAGSGDPEDVEKNKVFAVLAYLGILFVVPLIVARQSKFAMFHTNQGILLFIAFLVGWIPLVILSFILAFIPIVGGLISMMVTGGYSIGILILWILGIINAIQGQCKPLPVIGNLVTLVK